MAMQEAAASTPEDREAIPTPGLGRFSVLMLVAGALASACVFFWTSEQAGIQTGPIRVFAENSSLRQAAMHMVATPEGAAQLESTLVRPEPGPEEVRTQPEFALPVAPATPAGVAQTQSAPTVAAQAVQLAEAPVSPEPGPEEVALPTAPAPPSPSQWEAMGVEILKLRHTAKFSKDALQRGPGGHFSKFFDSGEKFVVTPALPEKMYIVGWRPVIAKSNCSDGSTVELVHHLNIVSYDEDQLKITFRNGATTAVGREGFRPFSNQHPIRFVASYDRGAQEYLFPPGVAIPVGPGTVHERLILEHHFLTPPCWDFQQTPSVWTENGYDLYVTRKRPERFAAVIGFIDAGMKVESGKGIRQWVSEYPPRLVANLFRDSFGRKATLVNHELELVAVHLHTHEVSDTKWLDIVGKDGTVKYTGKEQIGGYGVTQSIFNMADYGWPRTIVENGDSFNVHCSFNTHKFQGVMKEGTSHGEEMCSALLVVAGYANDGPNSLPGSFASLRQGHGEAYDDPESSEFADMFQHNHGHH